jgi:hypothetical protein
MRFPILGTLDTKNTRSFYRQAFLVFVVFGLLLLVPAWSHETAPEVSPIIYVLFTVSLVFITIGVAGLVYDYLRYDRLEFMRRREFIEQRSQSAEDRASGRASAKGGGSKRIPRLVSGAAFASELMELRAKLLHGPNQDGPVWVKLLDPDIINKTSHFLETEARISHLRESEEFFRIRIEEEIDALGGRGRVNLTIGAAFAVCGIIVLGIISVYSSYADHNDLLYRFAPRLTFVLFIESLAFFFLGLYRHSIFETKYFQNELTNLESRCIALENALFVGDSDLIRQVCASLASTERNFLLKKGETTIDIRLRELAQSGDKTLTDEFRKLADTLTSVMKDKTPHIQ